MRVNHAGEICAQALYQGQAIASRDACLTRELARAAREEVDHLAWTESRLAELGGRRSALVPLWYGGALGIGLLAGLAGDRWNLAFLAETERQVGEHLGGHLTRLPAADAKSREIVAQMRCDELAHAEMAIGLGGDGLPLPVQWMMRAAARVMTGVAYRL
jgi:ubiquinone biosynthesis monooxygenase Coq7